VSGGSESWNGRHEQVGVGTMDELRFSLSCRLLKTGRG
jgi:hypothetical protein